MVTLKKSFIVGTAILAAVLLFACATTGGAKWSDDGYVTTVADIEGYTGWHKVNDMTITGDQTGALGPAHEGAEGFREVFINKTGMSVNKGKEGFPYPVGTILVKESYAEKMGDLGSLTVMVKRGKMYDPGNGNWEYLMITPDNEVMAQGKVEMCIGCHAVAADTDFVFTSNRDMM